MPRRKGEVTDDTLQALALAESLLSCRRFDADDLMVRFIDMYRKRPRWFGPTSSVVFELILQGTAFQDAARLAHERTGRSRSNGSVMRGFPIGIFFAPASVPATSLACSALTHFDPAAGHASAFLNLMVSHMCRGTSRQHAFHAAVTACQNDEVLYMLGNYKDHTPDPSLDAIICAHAALACFMNANTFEDALVTAVSLGGDADTVGACTGALAGACWGIRSIPVRWSEALEDFHHIGSVAEELARTAQ